MDCVEERPAKLAPNLGGDKLLKCVCIVDSARIYCFFDNLKKAVHRADLRMFQAVEIARLHAFVR